MTRRGRPPIAGQAMTPAQRQQRYRERLAQDAISLLAQIAQSNEKMPEPRPATWHDTIDEILRLTNKTAQPNANQDDNYTTRP